MIKTNAMRLLDARKIRNLPHEYDAEITDGCTVADTLGEPRERVFKTLVTASGKGELEPLTGYVHGGCSPVGMKKRFRTFIDGSAASFETIFVSAGKRGVQMEVSPVELADFCGAVFAPVAAEETDG